MKLNKVLIATKQTALEYYRHNLENPEELLPKKLLHSKRLEHKEHYSSLDKIKSCLERNKISYEICYMPYAAEENFINKDLIIALGGDGTVLSAARFIKNNIPILPVKSEKDSLGALCVIDVKDFENTIKKILSGKFKIEKWTRAEGKFGSKTDIALNEIAIGSKHFSGLARYKIKAGLNSEIQKSSKIIISTGSGSTGWYANIPYSKDSFSRNACELRFIVSEHIKHHDYLLTHGVVLKDDVLEITSLMDIDGTISFDGDRNKRVYPFPLGQKIKIFISKKPLSVIVPY